MTARHSDVGAAFRIWDDAAKESTTDKAAAFAKNDPQAGLAWATNLTASDQRQFALESLAWACMTTHLGVALDALEQLPTGASRSRLVAQVAGQWAEGNRDDAQTWAENLPDAADAAVALEAFAVAIAEEFPERAAAIVADKLQPGNAQDRAVIGVLQRWIQTDPNAAQRWVARFPDSPLKAAAVAVLAGTMPPDPLPQFAAKAAQSR